MLGAGESASTPMRIGLQQKSLWTDKRPQRRCGSFRPATGGIASQAHLGDDKTMQVLLDDIECDVKARTVGEAIDAVAVLARNRGRLVVDVFVDGARWNEQRIASPERQTAVADVVRLISAEPAELVCQTLADAAEALADADDLQQEAARLLQSDEHTISMDKLNQAISIWLSVQQAIVKGSQLVGLDLDEIVVHDSPISASILRLNEQLKVVRSSLAGRDQIGLADTLLYEFPEVVQEWRDILDDLQRRIDPKNQ